MSFPLKSPTHPYGGEIKALKLVIKQNLSTLWHKRGNINHILLILGLNGLLASQGHHKVTGENTCVRQTFQKPHVSQDVNRGILFSSAIMFRLLASCHREMDIFFSSHFREKPEGLVEHSSATFHSCILDLTHPPRRAMESSTSCSLSA